MTDNTDDMMTEDIHIHGCPACFSPNLLCRDTRSLPGEHVFAYCGACGYTLRSFTIKG